MAKWPVLEDRSTRPRLALAPILPTAPRDDDIAHWLQRFDDESARRQPDSLHLAFGVDADALPHALPSWRAAGIDEFDATAC